MCPLRQILMGSAMNGESSRKQRISGLYEFPTELLLLIFQHLDDERSLLEIAQLSSRTRILAISLALARKGIKLSNEFAAGFLSVATRDNTFHLLTQAHFITSISTLHIELSDDYGWDYEGIMWWMDGVIKFVQGMPRIRALEVQLSSRGYWLEALQTFLLALPGLQYEEISISSLSLNYFRDSDHPILTSQTISYDRGVSKPTGWWLFSSRKTHTETKSVRGSSI